MQLHSNNQVSTAGQRQQHPGSQSGNPRKREREIDKKEVYEDMPIRKDKKKNPPSESIS
jgi:hypothetical protein